MRTICSQIYAIVSYLCVSGCTNFDETYEVDMQYALALWLGTGVELFTADDERFQRFGWAPEYWNRAYSYRDEPIFVIPLVLWLFF